MTGFWPEISKAVSKLVLVEAVLTEAGATATSFVGPGDNTVGWDVTLPTSASVSTGLDAIFHLNPEIFPQAHVCIDLNRIINAEFNIGLTVHLSFLPADGCWTISLDYFGGDDDEETNQICQQLSWPILPELPQINGFEGLHPDATTKAQLDDDQALALIRQLATMPLP